MSVIDKDIKDGNELIMEFMHWRLVYHEKTPDSLTDYYEMCLYDDDWKEIIETDWGGDSWNWGKGGTFPYHCRWDSLMPVVEKIESLGYNTEIAAYHKNPFLNWCSIHKCIGNEFGNEVESIVDPIESEFKIKCTWLAVIEFIKWHNENK